MTADTMNVGATVAVMIFLIAAALGAALTIAAVSWTQRRGILDHPNERSSHDRPTPRGGGVSVALLTLVAELVAWSWGLLSGRTAAALFLGGIVVAGIGAWDDLRTVSVRARLPVQVAAASAAVILLSSAGSAPAWGAGILGVVALLGIVWMTNLYNFMDGIDGIAGALGVAAGLGAAAVLLMLRSPGLALVALAIAGACAGFLSRNWSPARIFMGDVGSGFLGFTFGALTWAAVRAHGAVGFWLLMPLLPFIIDATATLLRRAARRAPVTEAHREHLYQRAVIAGGSHSPVAAAYGLAAALLAVVAVAAVRLPLQHAMLVAAAALLAVALFYVAMSALVEDRAQGRST